MVLERYLGAGNLHLVHKKAEMEIQREQESERDRQTDTHTHTLTHLCVHTQKIDFKTWLSQLCSMLPSWVM